MAGSRSEKVTYLVQLMVTQVVTQVAALERRRLDDERQAAEQAENGRS